MNSEPKKVFVAFLDILGFKRYACENDIGEVVHFVKNLFSLNARIGTAYVSTARHNHDNENIPKLGPTKKIKKHDGTEGFTPNLDVSNINSILIFDSIVLWTNDDKENDLVDLVSVVRYMLQSQLFIGFPLRGAISYGEFYFDDIRATSMSTMKHSILVSPAQVKAMILEKSQQWSGCILDQAVADRCRELNINLEANKSILAINYPVPMKKNIENYYTLIWFGQVYEYVGGKCAVNMSEYIKELFLKNTTICNEDIEEKIKNTVDFVLFSINYLAEENTQR